ncbi:MAG: hypothetical protein ACFFC7_20175 [Candidatus Hermodarchaeota archaeon]
MEKDKLVPGWGFYIDEDTHYLVEFSTKKDDWACSYIYQILTIPPIGHKLFDPIFRHERQHAFVYALVSRNKIFWWFWEWFFSVNLFNGFEELWVAFRSRSLRVFLKEPGNIIYSVYSITLLVLVCLVFLVVLDYWR